MATFDTQITTNANDGARQGTSEFSSTDATIRVGARNDTGLNPRDVWLRFTGIPEDLAGATIVSARLEYKIYDINPYSSTTVVTRIYAEAASAPTVPTNLTDYLSRSLTTAYTDWEFSYNSLGGNASFPWNAFIPTPDISAIIQELADNHSPSVIQILHKDNLGQLANRSFEFYAYDSSPEHGAKLFIEYIPVNSEEPQIFQTAVGVFADDGNEASSTLLGENVPVQVTSGEPFQVRMQANAVGAPGNKRFGLIMRKRLFQNIEVPAVEDWSAPFTVIEPGEWAVDSDGALYGSMGVTQVIKHNGVYFLYYIGHREDGPEPEYEPLHRAIHVATSADGLNWSKYAGNPVVTYDSNGIEDEEGAVNCAVVVDDEGVFHLWYGANHRFDVINYPLDVDGHIRYRSSVNGLDFPPETDVLVYDASLVGTPGEECYPQAALYKDGVFYLYFQQNDSVFFRQARRISGVTPTALGNDTVVFNGWLRIFGQFNRISPDKYLFIHSPDGFAAGTVNFRTLDADDLQTVSNVLATMAYPNSLTSKLFLDIDNERWLLFSYHSLNLVCRTAPVTFGTAVWDEWAIPPVGGA
jgi:hypothetical protein